MQQSVFCDEKVEHGEGGFNRMFPFLRIVFPNSNRHNVSGGAACGDINCLSAIPETMTILELETMLKNKWGMPVAIERKTLDVWIETALTKGWTLTQQNEFGKDLDKIKASRGTMENSGNCR